MPIGQIIIECICRRWCCARAIAPLAAISLVMIVGVDDRFLSLELGVDNSYLVNRPLILLNIWSSGVRILSSGDLTQHRPHGLTHLRIENSNSDFIRKTVPK